MMAPLADPPIGTTPARLTFSAMTLSSRFQSSRYQVRLSRCTAEIWLRLSGSTLRLLKIGTSCVPRTVTGFFPDDRGAAAGFGLFVAVFLHVITEPPLRDLTCP